MFSSSTALFFANTEKICNLQYSKSKVLTRFNNRRFCPLFKIFNSALFSKSAVLPSFQNQRFCPLFKIRGSALFSKSAVLPSFQNPRFCPLFKILGFYPLLNRRFCLASPFSQCNYAYLAEVSMF